MAGRIFDVKPHFPLRKVAFLWLAKELDEKVANRL
jgi:hypothetical protein